MIEPAPDVPRELARCAGAWNGAWPGAGGSEDHCTTLAVEEAPASGYARVVYSVGASATLGTGIPNVWRVAGRISGGALRFRLPTYARPALA